MPASGIVTKFRINPNLAAIPSAMLADGLVALANDIRDALLDGQIVPVEEVLAQLRVQEEMAQGERRGLIQVAIAFINAGFPGD